MVCFIVPFQVNMEKHKLLVQTQNNLQVVPQVVYSLLPIPERVADTIGIT
jgi:hypothetical protein